MTERPPWGCNEGPEPDDAYVSARQTKRAVVIPAADHDPIRIIEFTEQSLIGDLTREIGVDELGWTGLLRTEEGDMRMWHDDLGMLREGGYLRNGRAISVCWGVGYPVRDVAGTVVFTGGDEPDGESGGLTESLVAQFAATFTAVSISIDLDVDAMVRKLNEARRAEAPDLSGRPACTCEPLWTGEAPPVPDQACPWHGQGT